jgi:hypothetical protein
MRSLTKTEFDHFTIVKCRGNPGKLVILRKNGRY